MAASSRRKQTLLPILKPQGVLVKLCKHLPPKTNTIEGPKSGRTCDHTTSIPSSAFTSSNEVCNTHLLVAKVHLPLPLQFENLRFEPSHAQGQRFSQKAAAIYQSTFPGTL
eukprot:4692560-Amphidinium_carterae.1